MIHYYRNVQLTFGDIRNHGALLVHTVDGCMFHCFKCMNWNDIVATKQPKVLSVADILEVMERQKNLFEYVILSGGEILKCGLDDLIHDLTAMRQFSDKKIILYSTGYFLDKLKILWEKGLIDGIHLDVKLPYHLITGEDAELTKLTVGRALTDEEIITLQEAVAFVVEHDRGENQLRTIRYPFLDDSAFDAIAEWVDELNARYHQRTPYEVHAFIDADKVLEDAHPTHEAESLRFNQDSAI